MSNNSNVKIGSSYYSVLDVLKNKTLQSLLENNNEMNLNSNQIEKIRFIIESEIDSAKSWGYEQIKLK